MRKIYVVENCKSGKIYFDSTDIQEVLDYLREEGFGLNVLDDIKADLEKGLSQVRAQYRIGVKFYSI